VYVFERGANTKENHMQNLTDVKFWLIFDVTAIR